MKDPTPVTIMIITPESASTRRPSSTWKLPASIHRHSGQYRALPAGRVKMVMNAQVATANERNIEPGPTRLTALRPSRGPRNVLNNTPRAGKTRISASAANSTFIGLPSQQRQVVRVNGLAVAENSNDDGEADRGFGRSHRHYEKHDHLPIHTAEPAAE